MPPSAWLDLTGLAALAHEQPLDVRPVLLRVHTDLFVTAPVRDQETIDAFETLIMGLLPGADDLTAIRLARKLAPCPDAPAAVLASLAERGGEVLRLLIAEMPVLPQELHDRAVTGDDETAESLAHRDDISAATIMDLIARASPAIDFALAMNKAIVIEAEAMDILLVRSRSHAALAQALLSRGDLSAAEESSLYLQASASRRMALRERLGQVFAVRQVPLLIDREAAEDLEYLAGAGDRQGFADRLAEALGLRHTPEWRFEHPDRHELLALTLVTVGVPTETCIRIFLTLTPAISHSVQAVFALTEVARTVPRQVAAMLVEAILNVSLALTSGGRHQPVVQATGREVRSGTLRSSGQGRREPDARQVAR